MVRNSEFSVKVGLLPKHKELEWRLSIWLTRVMVRLCLHTALRVQVQLLAGAGNRWPQNVLWYH